MDAKTLAKEAQPHTTGLRASDKGFLNIRWRDYVELLSWTAKQRAEELIEDVPDSLKAVLNQVGIGASMWRDLVWNFKKYFGKSSCAGSPKSKWCGDTANASGGSVHKSGYEPLG